MNATLTAAITALRENSPRATVRTLTPDGVREDVQRAVSFIRHDGHQGTYRLSVVGGYVANSYKYPAVGDICTIEFSVNLAGVITLAGVKATRCEQALCGLDRPRRVLRHVVVGQSVGRLVKSW